MFVKVNRVSDSGDRVFVTKLDIDDFGSVVPLKDLELGLPKDDDSILQTLKAASHAAIFTEDDSEEPGSTIILAKPFTEDELNDQKASTIRKAEEKKTGKA